MLPHFLLLSLLLWTLDCGPILDNFPVTFQMLGPTNYTPNSAATTISGYKLKLGYVNHEWLAVEIVGDTLSDVLVLKQDPFYSVSTSNSFAGHVVTVTDYNALDDVLKNDTNTTQDSNSVSYVNSRSFSTTISRSLSSHNNEDWNAALHKYSVIDVCFYTSANSFNASSWKVNTTSKCYGFQITNYRSTFRGIYLKDIKLNGYNVNIFGYLDGPYPSSNVFFYQEALLGIYTSDPAIVLELGATGVANRTDYNVFSTTPGESGDYYGSSIASLALDTGMSGFQNSGLSVEYQNTNPGVNNDSEIGTSNLKISFRRNISTYDTYDKTLLSTFSFCIYLYGRGSIYATLTDKYCDVVELSKSYVQLAVPDTSNSYQLHYSSTKILASLIMLVILIVGN